MEYHGECSEVSANSVSRNTETRERLSCFCNKPVILLKSWTNENPGRRFYRCPGYKSKNSCNYFAWFDKEKISGWPKFSLLEARDEIRENRREIKKLTDMIDRLEQENRRFRIATEVDICSDLRSFEADFEQLKTKCSGDDKKKMKLKKRVRQLDGEKHVLRISLMYSWIFFICIISIGLYYLRMSSM